MNGLLGIGEILLQEMPPGPQEVEFRQMFEIEIYVVNDVKVEVAVVIVISECGAGAPSAFVSDTGFLGDIGEMQAAVVAVEHIRLAVAGIEERIGDGRPRVEEPLSNALPAPRGLS